MGGQYRGVRTALVGLAIVATVAAVLFGIDRAGRLHHFEFGVDDDTEGWAGIHQIDSLAVGDGALKIDPAGRDPLLVLSRPFRAEDVNWIEVRARFTLGTQGVDELENRVYEAIHHELTFYWTADQAEGFSPEVSVTGNALMDGRFHTVRIPIGSHPRWSGEIRQLCLDALDETAPWATIEIDRISLLKHRISPLGSWTGWAIVLPLALIWIAIVGGGAARVSPGRRRLALLLLLILGPLSLLVGVETVLNLLGFERLLQNEQVRVVFEEIEAPGYDELFQYDPDCLFVNRPGTEYRKGERINRLGLRGPLFSGDRETLRVASFGDSSTFGFGLDLEATYASQLQESLRGSTGKTEVLNAGVIAYTAMQGLELFKSRVIEQEPDVVTLAFGAFNEHYPGPLSDRERIELSRTIPTWLYRTRRFLQGELKLFQLVAGTLGRGEGPDGGLETAAAKPRVSPEEFTEILESFLERSQAHGIQLVIVSFPRRRTVEQEYPQLIEYTRRMHAFCDAHDVPLANLREAFFELEDYEARYFLDSVHLNPEGNAIAGRLLAEAIQALDVKGRRTR